MINDPFYMFNNKKYLILSILYIMLIIVIICYANDNNKTGFWKDDLIETYEIYENEIKKEGERYYATGIDPYVVYGIKEGTYSTGVVCFKNKSEKNTLFCFYYADKGEDFSEERKIIAKLKTGEEHLVFELPYPCKINAIRLDYEGSAGESVKPEDSFDIAEVYCVTDDLMVKIHRRLSFETLCTVILGTIGFLLACLVMINQRRISEMDDSSRRLIIVLEISSIIIIPLIPMWRYVFGSNVFAFSDVRWDSLYQSYPQLVHLAKRIESQNWERAFTFFVGLGNEEGAIIPGVTNWVAFFGENHIPRLLGVNQYLQMVLSGVFAYGLACLFETDDVIKCAIAIGYEFNSMLTVRSGWYTYPTLALLIIMVLFFFELDYKYKDIQKCGIYSAFLCTACFIFFINMGTFNSILYGAIFFIYFLVRTISDERRIRDCVKYEIILVLFCALGNADSFLRSIAGSVSSPRFSGGVTGVTNSLTDFLVFRWEMLFEAFERSIGQTIGGFSDDFIGINNIADGPAFYCGIFVLLALPAALYNLTEKKKRWFAAGGILVVLFIAVPLLREVAAGFSSASFRYNSFWVTILEILVLLEAAKNVRVNGLRKGTRLVYNVSASVSLFLLMLISLLGHVARYDCWIISVIYVIVYLISVNSMLSGITLGPVLALFIVFEGVFVGGDIFDYEPSVTKSELEELYHDVYYKAVKDIQTEDTDWYRLEKLPMPVTSMCDSQVQEYMGTASYVGGTGISLAVQNYVAKLAIPSSQFRWIYGTIGNVYASSLMGVKYLLSESAINSYGWKFLKKVDNVNVYENTLALPIGYYYSDTIEEEDFERLSYWDRNTVLTEKALVYDVDNRVLDEKDHEEKRFYGKPHNYRVNRDKVIDVSKNLGRVLVIDINYKNNGEVDEKIHNGGTDQSNMDLFIGEGADEAGTVYWTDTEGITGYKKFSHDGVLELDALNILNIWFDSNIVNEIDSIDLYTYDINDYYRKFTDSVNRLKANSMEVTSYNNNEIIGSINVPEDGIFVTSIPYNSAWDIFIDGEKKEIFQVNAGFIGSPVTKGWHDIYISYNHPSWISTNKFKIIGAGVLLVVYCMSVITGVYENKKHI